MAVPGPPAGLAILPRPPFSARGRCERPRGFFHRWDLTMARESLLTPEGYEKLKAEIEHLRTIKRREVAERIKEAREFGDISENAEYDHAKNEQAMLEARIAGLEDKLRVATVIDEKQVEAGVGPIRP